MYFAYVLKDDATKRYADAAQSGKLLSYNHSAIQADSFDAYCIATQHIVYQETLWHMKAMLEQQMQKEHFWEISEDFLLELGGYVQMLNAAKIALLASEYMEQKGDRYEL